MQRHLVSGPFRLDLLDESLWCDHEPVPLTGKAFALLRELMRTPQTLVTKDQLFDRVWPGMVVSESALTTAMKDLRRALGDEARTPRVIKTVHGRGYRYLLPVSQADVAPSLFQPHTNWRVGIGVGAALALLAFFGAQILTVPEAHAAAVIDPAGSASSRTLPDDGPICSGKPFTPKAGARS